MARELGAPGPGAWDNGTELLASTVEVLGDLRRMFYSANTKKGTKPLKPIRVPRPGDRSNNDRKKPLTGPDLATALALKGLRVIYTPTEDDEEVSADGS